MGSLRRAAGPFFVCLALLAGGAAGRTPGITIGVLPPGPNDACFDQPPHYTPAPTNKAASPTPG